MKGEIIMKKRMGNISDHSGDEYRNSIIETLEGLKEVFHME